MFEKDGEGGREMMNEVRLEEGPDKGLAAGEPATIDHQSVQVTVNASRPNSMATRSLLNQSAISSIQPNGTPIKTNAIHFDSLTSSVVFQDPNNPNVAIVAPKPDPSHKPKDFVMFSCFVILCCNFIFGFLGYNYGVKSNNAWQLGDIEQARKRAKTALIFDIVGILCGLATWVLAFTLYFACQPCNPFRLTHEP